MNERIKIVMMTVAILFIAKIAFAGPADNHLKGLENAMIKSHKNVGKSVGHGGTLVARDGKPGKQVVRSGDTVTKPPRNPYLGPAFPAPVEPGDGGEIPPIDINPRNTFPRHGAPGGVTVTKPKPDLKPMPAQPAEPGKLKGYEKNDGKELGNGGTLVARDGKPGMQVTRPESVGIPLDDPPPTIDPMPIDPVPGDVVRGEKPNMLTSTYQPPVQKNNRLRLQ